MAEMDDDELLDALGVEVAPIKAASRTPGRNASSQASRTSFGFIKIMAGYLNTAKVWIFSSVCMR